MVLQVQNQYKNTFDNQIQKKQVVLVNSSSLTRASWLKRRGQSADDRKDKQNNSIEYEYEKRICL